MKNDLDKLIASVNLAVRTKGSERVNGKVASLRTQEFTCQVMRESSRRLHKLGFYLADISGLQDKHIKALVSDWHQQGLSNKTIQNQFSRIKIFCGWIGLGHLIRAGGVPGYLPEVEAKTLRVSTVADASKSWSMNGIDIPDKIRQARLQDQRHAHMLLLGIAFGLRKKEMLRIKLWKSDKGNTLDIDGSVAKNGRFRSIGLEAGAFGAAQRWALDEAKKVCGKSETLGWPGLSIKQAENRYYHFNKKLGLTKFDCGATGHGVRAEYAENLLLLRGLMPPTLGGSVAQMSKVERDDILLDTQNKMGHGDLHTASAYFGSFRNYRHVDGLGGRIGTVILVDSEKDIFALLYANPAPSQMQDGSYKIKTTDERNNTQVTVVVEAEGMDNQQMSVLEFTQKWESLTIKVHRQLVLVGLGE